MAAVKTDYNDNTMQLFRLIPMTTMQLLRLNPATNRQLLKPL